MNFYSGKINELASFYKAFVNTRREMFLSLIILLALTFVLSLVFYFFERMNQPEVFDSYWSCLVWAYSRYIEAGDGVFDGGPVTVIGRLIAFLLGVIGIAIVAIPAGLIGSGFMDAVAEEKREKEIEEYRDNLQLAFRELVNVAFREYSLEHPEYSIGENKSGFYIPSFVPMAKIEMRYGMNNKDIFETAAKYPEFRIANLASMQSEEDNPNDRFVVTHQYINTSYGCCIDRDSRITIVSTSSVLETVTGWYGFYLAMIGGFNYISKEIEPNIGDFDSFAAMTEEIKVQGYSWKELNKDKSKNAEKIKLYKRKEQNRKDYLADVKKMCKGEDSWLIFINASIMNSSNTDEFHFSISKANGKDPMILDENISKYMQLFESFADMVSRDFGYSAIQSDRYRLPLGFTGYKIKKEEPTLKFNALKINIGSKVLLDNRRMIMVYKMAESINDSLCGAGIKDYDRKYLATRHFGLRDYHPELIASSPK